VATEDEAAAAYNYFDSLKLATAPKPTNRPKLWRSQFYC